MTCLATNQRSFARASESEVASGRIKVYRRLVRDRAVSHGAFRLWHYLRDRADAQGACYPGQRLIRKDLGADPHSLKGWTEQLVHGQYLRITGRGSRGVFRYQVLDGTGQPLRKSTTLGNSSVAENHNTPLGKSTTLSVAENHNKSNNKEVITRSKATPTDRIALEKKKSILEGQIRKLEDETHYEHDRLKHPKKVAELNEVRQQLLEVNTAIVGGQA
jgi:hypothetical protein